MDDFTLGEPALVCRWRLAGGELPLCNRHLRALGARQVNGTTVPKALVSWAKQHIEWTLADGSVEHPDGVLMVVIDKKGRAAMAVGPYEEPKSTSTGALVNRARAAAREATSTQVSPETLWAFADGAFMYDIASGQRASGASSLCEDLAKTLGIPVTRRPGLTEEVMDGRLTPEELFLVSDEHGVLGATGRQGMHLAEGFERLFEQARQRNET